MKSVLFSAALAATLLSGCSTVELKPGAENVRVATPDEVSSCTLRGKTDANTMSSVGFIPRGNVAMTSEVEMLAKNAALKMNGNVVAPESELLNGTQTFGIYYCP